MQKDHNDVTPAFAIHPGEILKDMLKDRGWTQRYFANKIGRPVQLISKIINGHSGITAETAIDFATAFEMSPKFWMDLESRYRLDSEMKLRQGNYHMKFPITLDRDEDGVWIAECPSIPGCVSQGKTKDEAVTNVREAIALCLQVRVDKGLPLTTEQ